MAEFPGAAVGNLEDLVGDERWWDGGFSGSARIRRRTEPPYGADGLHACVGSVMIPVFLCGIDWSKVLYLRPLDAICELRDTICAIVLACEEFQED
jgi:hypothetical protein